MIQAVFYFVLLLYLGLYGDEVEQFCKDLNTIVHYEATVIDEIYQPDMD